MCIHLCNEKFMHCNLTIISSLCNFGWPVLADTVWSRPALTILVTQGVVAPLLFFIYLTHTRVSRSSNVLARISSFVYCHPDLNAVLISVTVIIHFLYSDTLLYIINKLTISFMLRKAVCYIIKQMNILTKTVIQIRVFASLIATADK